MRHIGETNDRNVSGKTVCISYDSGNTKSVILPMVFYGVRIFLGFCIVSK